MSDEQDASLVTKEPTTFLSLPFELREHIMDMAHQMTLAELPASHPHITNTITRRRHRRGNGHGRPAAETVLHNPKPPVGLSPKALKKFLHDHPGQWGPIFEVMYTCKALIEEARAIRYKEIRIIAPNARLGNPRGGLKPDTLSKDDGVLMERLSFKPLMDYTRNVVIEIANGRDTVLFEKFVAALEKFVSLKHLFIIVKVYEFRGEHEGLMSDCAKDIFLFFGLKVDSLTIRYEWAGFLTIRPEFSRHVTQQDQAFARLNLDLLKNYWGLRYRASSWYKVPSSNKELVAVGKVVAHLSKPLAKENGVNAFEEQYFFAPPEDIRPSPCPKWETRIPGKNPYNHPDQLEDM